MIHTRLYSRYKHRGKNISGKGKMPPVKTFFNSISKRRELDKKIKNKIDQLVNLSSLATNRNREAAIKIQRAWKRTKTPEHKLKLSQLVDKMTKNYIQMNKVNEISRQLENVKLFNRNNNGNAVMTNINIRKK